MLKISEKQCSRAKMTRISFLNYCKSAPHEIRLKKLPILLRNRGL
jgi:hypothetical protein